MLKILAPALVAGLCALYFIQRRQKPAGGDDLERIDAAYEAGAYPGE